VRSCFFVTLERLVLSSAMLPKIDAALIFMLSIVLVMALYFVDESTYSLAALQSWNELRNFYFLVILNTAFSLALYAISLSTSHKKKITYNCSCGFSSNGGVDYLEFGRMNYDRVTVRPHAMDEIDVPALAFHVNKLRQPIKQHATDKKCFYCVGTH
jgi:hypothetical protein